MTKVTQIVWSEITRKGGFLNAKILGEKAPIEGCVRAYLAAIEGDEGPSFIHLLAGIALEDVNWVDLENSRELLDKSTNEVDNSRMYELYYDDGGHGGPYESLESAWEAGKRYIKGCKHTTCIELRRRNSKVIGGFTARNSDSMYLYRDQLNCLYSGANML